MMVGIMMKKGPRQALKTKFNRTFSANGDVG